MSGVSWIDASGTEHDMGPGGELVALDGADGLWATTMRLTEVARPSGNGTVVRRTVREAADLSLPVYIPGADAADFWDRLGRVRAWFNPLRGPGRLRVANPLGRVRELSAYYTDGLEAGAIRLGGGSARAVLGLRAPDPWQDAYDTVYAFDLSAATVAFLSDPFLPLKISASQILSSPTITNDDDFEAWPVWTITGPGSNIVLSNTATWPGDAAALTKLINFQGALDSGAVVTIDTRPDYKVIYDAGGNGLRAYLSADSELWSLAPGDNAIQVQMDGAGGTSSVKLVYRRLGLGP